MLVEREQLAEAVCAQLGHQKHRRRAIAGALPQTFQANCRRPRSFTFRVIVRGETRWIQISAQSFPKCGFLDQTAGLVGFAFDVTNRPPDQTAARTFEADYQPLTGGSSGLRFGTFHVNFQSGEECRSRTLDEICAGAASGRGLGSCATSHAIVAATMDAVRHDRPRSTLKHRVGRENGAEHWLHVAARALFHPKSSGRADILIGLVADVTIAGDNAERTPRQE